MVDDRSFAEIARAHPGPWLILPTGAIRAGSTELRVMDAANGVVPLFTVLKVATVVMQASAAGVATNQSKAA